MKKIAILCDFPLFEVSSKYRKELGHYAVWLVPFFHKLLSENDFEIHWVVFSKSVRKLHEFTVGNQYFHVCPTGSLMLGMFTCFLGDYFRIRKILDRISPQLIHAWGTEKMYAMVGTLYAKSRRVLSLIQIQGALNAYCSRGEMPVFFKFQRYIERYVFKKNTYFCVESPWAKNCVLEYNPRAKVYINEYAVEERFFKVKRKLTKDPTCIYAGSLCQLKGLDYLFKAFSDDRLKDVKLLVAGGDGGQFPNLPSNVCFLGRLGRDRLANILAECWCLVHPSLADTGPTIVKEARVMGIPVVLTSDCGSKQHIVHGKSGYVISPKSSEELVDAILKVVESPQKSIDMGEYGLDSCKKTLSADSMSKGFFRIYKELLENTHI